MDKLGIFHANIYIYIRNQCYNGTVKLVKPSSNCLTDRSKAALLLCFFLVCFCLCHTVLSVSCSLVGTCWERACLGMCSCVFVTFP